LPRRARRPGNGDVGLEEPSSLRDSITDGMAVGEPEEGLGRDFAVSERPVPLLEIEHLVVDFKLRHKTVHAVADVSFALEECETLGVVGESGCGKSTLIRSVARLNTPLSGVIRFRGGDITHVSRRKLRPIRHELQMVFQDPQSSLNPRQRVGQIIATPMRVQGVPRRQRTGAIEQLLRRVGLKPEHVDRFPHEFSGGQRQRIGIARALAAKPKIVLLDEPVSALDVSIQAQVLNLLNELQEEFALSYVFVAHDLAVIRHVADRVMVMYAGKVVETAPVDGLYTKPIHPYTMGLLGAIPIPDPRQSRARTQAILQGEPPSALAPPHGCRFASRCAFADAICRELEPPLVAYRETHLAACHHPQSVTRDELRAARVSTASPLAARSALPTCDGPSTL
jgi:peptide/nickel transport system ATP-binding protein